MKLSMETCVLRQIWDDMRAIEMAKEAGFDSIDYSFYWTKPGQSMLEGDYIGYAKQLRAKLDEQGMTCNQAHAPFELKEGQPWSLDCAEYREIVRSLEFAAILGTEHIIVHAIGAWGDEDVVAHNIRYYKSLEPYARQYGIKIAVENLFTRDGEKGWKGRLGSPEELKKVLAELDPEQFIVCVDLGHAALIGYPPEDFVRGLDKNILLSLHVQDTDGRDDIHTIPGQGIIRWDDVCKALGEIGYQGDLTLEIFGFLRRVGEDAIPEALKLAEKIGRRLIGKIESAR